MCKMTFSVVTYLHIIYVYHFLSLCVSVTGIPSYLMHYKWLSLLP